MEAIKEMEIMPHLIAMLKKHVEEYFQRTGNEMKSTSKQHALLAYGYMIFTVAAISAGKIHVDDVFEGKKLVKFVKKELGSPLKTMEETFRNFDKNIPVEEIYNSLKMRRITQ